MMDKLKWQKQRLLDGEPGYNATPAQQDDALSCPSLNLSYKERLFGCLLCFLLGMVLSLGSTVRLAQLVRGRPAPFAICYTLGNVLSLCCTMFFVGPVAQCKSMFDAKRRVSAAIYVVFIGVTLALCFSPHIPHRAGLVLLSVLIQFGALWWYTLSYIPYARAAVAGVFKKFCCQEDQV
ncbi:hypothetical protein SDRG_12795 [Saprolegnia diclina VS20]|uniref:Vesicle transport protein n=1 Tax=Saprolegnia diclina (strain VS20) TaxID=1156394 RepID=T0Q4M7_SAPDV|nr:hypothetical protein SDRG_12795 [Saprolegnia diclina VS20]EQC29546.1 hypothetical protein SDRG_12795 [Saprolegnia diclina VS20]|eukprot:XP_008617098.1 hypothetical protein SDRG_12795 [Saprolegnia diclina VS20]